MDFAVASVHLERLDAAALAHDAVAAFSVRGASVVAEGVERPLVVDADPVRLRQVLDNLIANALTHAGSGGPVTVRVTAARDRRRDRGLGCRSGHPARRARTHLRARRASRRGHDGLRTRPRAQPSDRRSPRRHDRGRLDRRRRVDLHDRPSWTSVSSRHLSLEVVRTETPAVPRVLADRKRRVGGREVDVGRRHAHRRRPGSGIDLRMTGLLDDDVRGRVARLHPREANEIAVASRQVIVSRGSRSRAPESRPKAWAHQRSARERLTSVASQACTPRCPGSKNVTLAPVTPVRSTTGPLGAARETHDARIARPSREPAGTTRTRVTTPGPPTPSNATGEGRAGDPSISVDGADAESFAQPTTSARAAPR